MKSIFRLDEDHFGKENFDEDHFRLDEDHFGEENFHEAQFLDLTKTISTKRISMKPTFRLDEDHFGEENYRKPIFGHDEVRFNEDSLDEDHF